MIGSKKILSSVLAVAMVFQAGMGNVSAAVTPEVRDAAVQVVSEPERVYVNAYGTGERSVSFNDHWRFYLGELNGAEAVAYNDSAWEDVNLPHDYSVDQGFSTAAPAEQESGYVLGGTGWYRKYFTLPEDMAGKEVSIEFDGVYMNATVYLNGKQLGTHPYGYTPFSFTLPEEDLNFDGRTNVLTVKVEHKQPSSRWYSGSGIYRDVKLTVTDPVHVAYYGTAVTTPEIADGKGKVSVVTAVQNDSDKDAEVSVRQVVYEQDGTEPVAEGVKTAAQTVAAGQTAEISDTVTVESPKLWSTETPNMYTVRTEVYVGDTLVDSYDSDFGFRWVSFTADNGFFLNGKNVKLKGVSMHHDQGGLGSEAWYRSIERQVEKLQQMGVNAIRVTHNPASQVLIDICNRKGMMLVEEAFDCWLSGKAGNTEDFGKWFEEPIEEGNQIVDGEAGMQWSEFDLKAMVKRGRNHPSIIMWSLGNEVFQQLIDSSQNSRFPDVAKNLIKWVGEEDTTRYVSFGDNQMKGNVNANNDPVKTADVIAEAEKYGSVPGGLVGFNYGGASQIQSGYNKGWMVYGSETASSINSRGVYDRKTNGSDGGRGDKRLTSYDKSCVSWGHLAASALWITMTQPFNAGEFVWTGFDYIGEPTPDNWQGTGANGTWPNIAKNSYFGIIDTAGFPKDSFYLYQSQWNDSLHTLHVLPVWNEDEIVIDGNGKVEVVVYSDAPVVKLYLNGEEVGTATAERTNTPTGGYQNYTSGTGCFDTGKASGYTSLYATFNVPYEEGKLEAKAFEADGTTEITGTDGRSYVETTKNPTKLTIEADRKTITADGKDLSYITIDVTDADGKFVNGAEPEITVSVEGAGKLLALDNGVQNDVTSYSEPTRKAGKGKLLAIVQSTDKAGSFTVTASASGYQSVEEKVTTEAESGDPQEKYVVSYELSRNYYLKPGTVPVLPKKVTVYYSDDTSEEKDIVWGDIPSEENAYSVVGAITGLDIKVQVNVTEVGNVTAILNYSAAIGKDAEIALPAARPAVEADGSIMKAEFPVTWDVPENLTASVGTKIVKGTADVFGESYEVTASVRVTSGGYRDGDEALPNVPEMYINGISSAQNSGVADTLAKLRDNKTSKMDVAWTGRGTLDFRLDTAIELKDFTLYLKDTAPVSTTMKVYSSNDNGANWVPADCKISNRKEDGVTVRTLTPANTISETWFRLEFEKMTTLLEVEMNTRIPTFTVGSEAALSSLKVDGHIANAATLEKGWFGVMDTTLDAADVQAAGKDNASITILPKDDKNIIRILMESENHAVRGIYQVLLGEDNTKVENANDASLDYPYASMTLTAPSWHGAEPPAKANDGAADTIWHSRWGDTGSGEKDLREREDLRYLQIELKDTKAIKGLRYLPRSKDKNGIVMAYRIEVSTDGENWSAVASGDDWSTAVEWKMVQFDEVDAKYIRLYGVSTSDNSGNVRNEFMSAAEVRVQCVASEIHSGNTTAVLAEAEKEVDYTGKAIEPEPVVTYKASADAEGVVLTKDADYTLSYRNNTEPGTATVVVTGIGSYTGVVETEFTIHDVDVEIEEYEETAVTTARGEYPVLPGTITAKTTIGDQLVEVRWDSVSSSLLNRFHTFTVYGTVTETNARVAAKVTVSDVIGVGHATLTTAAGIIPVMPDQVTVYYSNGDAAKREVTWDMPENGFDNVGIVTVMGKVGNADAKATVRVGEAAADANNTPVGANLALNENGINESTTWPRTFAYVSSSNDLAHRATDGVKEFVSGSGKRIWSDWEDGVYHTNADAGVNDSDRQPFVATAFGTKGSTDNAAQKKYTVNKVSIGFMEEDGTDEHKVRLPQNYKIEYYSASDGVIAANRLLNSSSGVNNGCSDVRSWGQDNPIKTYDGWTEVTYIGGKPAVPSVNNFKKMVDVAFEPVETTAIRITLAPQAENWTGLEEFEVYYEPVSRFDSYEVSKISIDGQDVLAQFDEETKTLEVTADTGVITAEATNNASVTVLEAVNGTARVIFLPENGDAEKKQEYTVKFRHEEGKETYVVAAEEAEVEMAGSAAAGDTVTFSAKAGYEFTEMPVIVRSDNNQVTDIKVTQNGSSYSFVMPAYAVTIRGALKGQENVVYTVTFDSNGGSAVASQQVPSSTGIASEPAAPTKRGYDFAGWFSDRSLTAAWNFASAVTGNMTLYAKWTPARITVNTKIPAYLIGNTGYRMPEQINISVTGETFDTPVVWNEADVTKLLAATEVSANTVRGTLTQFENREISVSVAASVANIIYFVDSGASEFTALGQLLADVNEATMKNKTPDDAYSESTGWGYTNPETELEVNGSGDAYDSIRNFVSGVTGKTLTYRFALDAGTYEVTAGFYDPWAQWANDNRHAKVSVTDLAGKELAAKADHNIKEKEQVSFTDITLDKKGSICLHVAPTNTGDNSDTMISFIVIRKTADFTNEKAALASAVAIAEKLSADDYTEESYAALTAAVEAAKEVIKAGDSTAEEIQAQFDAVAAAIAGLKSSHADDGDLEELRKQVETLAGQLNTANEQIKALQGQISGKDTEIRGLKDQVSAKESELTAANNQINSLNGQLQNVNGQLQSLKTQLEAANNEKTALENQLAQASGEKDELLKQISEKEKEIRTLRGQISEKDAEVITLQGQISEKETQISILNNEISRLNNELETAEGEKADLLEELKTVKEEAGVLDVKLASAEGRVKELESLMKQQQTDADNINKQLSQAKEEIEKLKNQIAQSAAKGLKVGDYKEVKGVLYRVTNAEKKLAEAYGVTYKSLSYIHVLSSVKINGKTCKVTAIAKNAFANMKKLRKVVIGKSVTSIGRKAFYKDAKLTNITVKSKKITEIGKNAFKGVSAKAKVYVPNGKKIKYRKLFKGKGLKKTVVFELIK